MRGARITHLLTEVVALTITDFVMFDDLPGLINTYKLRTEDGDLYSSDLELVLVELPKCDKPEAELTSRMD